MEVMRGLVALGFSGQFLSVGFSGLDKQERSQKRADSECCMMGRTVRPGELATRNAGAISRLPVTQHSPRMLDLRIGPRGGWPPS